MLWSIEYYYDAYGRIINKVDTSGINLSEINPFRYRSYYQDDETGWYYLNSRYYDIDTLRFVTMDDICYLGANGSGLSHNLYSYCENNPVNNIDSNGNYASSLILASAVLTKFSTAFSGIIASITASLSSIKTAIATAWLPVLAMALVGASIIGLVYAIRAIASIVVDSARVRAQVRTAINKGGIDPDNTYNHTVYVIVGRQDQEVYYVGRTNKFTRRSNEHARGKYPRNKYEIIAVATGMSYRQARAMEQTLIIAYGLQALNNCINSIRDKKWGKFVKEFNRAASILSSAYDD